MFECILQYPPEVIIIESPLQRQNYREGWFALIRENVKRQGLVRQRIWDSRRYVRPQSWDIYLNALAEFVLVESQDAITAFVSELVKLPDWWADWLLIRDNLKARIREVDDPLIRTNQWWRTDADYGFCMDRQAEVHLPQGEWRGRRRDGIVTQDLPPVRNVDIPAPLRADAQPRARFFRPIGDTWLDRDHPPTRTSVHIAPGEIVMFENGIKLVGADPEIFLKRKDGTPQSVEGLVGGTKARPKQMDDLPTGYTIQEDNVAVEFNIPPAAHAREFSNAIAKAVAYVHKIAKNKELDLAFVSALSFPEDQLQTRHARTLGCEPDYNAWTNEINPRPIPPGKLRTAAGHIHLGWDSPSQPERLAIVKACDLFLGVPSVLVEAATERRSLYGAAGACRFKDYGVEYRSLGNFWLPSAAHREFIFNRAKIAADTIKTYGERFLEELDDNEEAIRACINRHDKDLAFKLIRKFRLEVFPEADAEVKPAARKRATKKPTVELNNNF